MQLEEDAKGENLLTKCQLLSIVSRVPVLVIVIMPDDIKLSFHSKSVHSIRKVTLDIRNKELNIKASEQINIKIIYTAIVRSG